MNNAFKKRIDELGRIVIPKQIRDDFKINNFDELDIFIKDDGIIIKKNSGIISSKKKIEKFVNYITKLVNFDIILFNNNDLIISTLIDNNGFLENKFEYNTVIYFNNIFMYKTSIIIDSNYYGDIIFVSNIMFEKDNNDIKNIKSILLDLIK